MSEVRKHDTGSEQNTSFHGLERFWPNCIKFRVSSYDLQPDLANMPPTAGTYALPPKKDTAYKGVKGVSWSPRHHLLSCDQRNFRVEGTAVLKTHTYVMDDFH